MPYSIVSIRYQLVRAVSTTQPHELLARHKHVVQVTQLGELARLHRARVLRICLCDGAINTTPAGGKPGPQIRLQLLFARNTIY